MAKFERDQTRVARPWAPMSAVFFAAWVATAACSNDSADDEGSDDGSDGASGAGAMGSAASRDTGGRSGTGGVVADSGGNDGAAASSGSSTGGERSDSDACRVFSRDSPWNTDISNLPVHENSAAFVASVGDEAHMHPDFGTVWDGAPIGIPYAEVDGATSLSSINYTDYGDESDSGPFPIPLDAPIEGGAESGGDRHVLAIDWENCILYELYHAFPRDDAWDASSGAKYDLAADEDHPEGCTSADAAGLPIFPGLVRYDEVVERGKIDHALRFTVQRSQRGYVYPARHYASSETDPDLPPMGLRFRMKHDYDCSPYSTEVRVICTALKTYGMFVADNGSNWYLSGAPDSRWDDDALGDLKDIPGSAFEVVDTGETIVTDAPGCELPR